MPSAAEILQFFGMRGQTSPEDSLGAAEFWNQYKGKPAAPIPSTPGEPTIQARQPSVLDRIGYALQGDQRASLGQQRAIANIKSLAEMTPLAALDAKGPQEAALAILPGAGGPMGKEAMAAAKAGIRAYHGSPHSFERFELSPKTIGTGEGAQAYGHGLYFAENEGVARGYRDSIGGHKLTYDGKPSGATAETAALDYLDPRIVREKGAAAAFSEAIPRLRERTDTMIYPMAADRLERLDPSKVKPAGHMYEVNINAKPEQFLDWDKPLVQQPRDVVRGLERVSSIAPEYLKSERLTGGQLAPQTMQGVEQMREAGIPGIKFLDQGSRAGGIPTSIEAIEGGKWRVSLKDPNNITTRHTFNDEAAAQAFAKKQATPTSNYVVFDDKLIDILRKYGLAGMGMLGAGGAAYDSAQTPRY
jgi:hypothetical protein